MAIISFLNLEIVKDNGKIGDRPSNIVILILIRAHVCQLYERKYYIVHNKRNFATLKFVWLNLK